MSVIEFPDMRHMTAMDRACEAVRAATQDNDELTFAECIAILEMVKMDIFRDIRAKHGYVDEE